jgi:hypothetical protein
LACQIDIARAPLRSFVTQLPVINAGGVVFSSL